MNSILKHHCDRKQDKLNAAAVRLFDVVQLDARECEELLAAINERLPGPGNRIAHELRSVLILAMDVMATEDAIVAIEASPTP